MPEVSPTAPPGGHTPAERVPEALLSVVEVRGLDWNAVRAAVDAPIAGERADRIIARMEERLASRGPLGLAFEEYAAGPADQAIQVGEDWPVGEVWFIGDLHGDLLALEAALQHIDRSGGGADARIVFLGDLFDDGVHAAEVVLRVFELVLDGPMRVTVIAGNHDEA
ncbi:MAG TPA: metallophosphoesterase, partial [Longimicrobium sp.]|nr:metallophosphoesterase [Longimicrobium sp.]